MPRANVHVSDSPDPALGEDLWLRSIHADPAAAPGLLDGADAAPHHNAQALRAALGEGELAALIERIVDRDEYALQTLYDATCSRVHGLVLRITRRGALAEEVVEDTYWQVWRQAPRFDAERGKCITWLLAMARSRAIDALRRNLRFQHEPLPEDGSAGTPDTAADHTPDELLQASRGAQHLHQALMRLDARSRQLVALAFFRGLTHEEIAEQVALPLGSVKSIIRRALQELRSALAPD